MTDKFKVANVDEKFEQAFFQLAYDKLQSKLKGLLPYFIAFQVVDRNDESGKAVGVFVFRAENNNILLVPAFFINGKVPDLDLMLLKNNNQFYPLNEDFASLFLKSDVTEVGHPSNETKEKLKQDMPPVDLRDMAIPPRTGRYAVASVLDYVKDGGDTVKAAFWKLLNEDTDFLEGVSKFYSPEKIAAAIVPSKKKVASDSKIQVYKHISELNGISKIAAAEAMLQLSKHGVAIIDTRAEDAKSQYGFFDLEKKFTIPTESGFYNYLTEFGDLRKGLILVKPYNIVSGFPSSEYYVINLEDPYRLTTRTDAVLVKNPGKIQQFNINTLTEDPNEVTPKNPNELSSDSSLNRYFDYFLINENLKAIGPFRIEARFKDARGIQHLQITRSFEVPASHRGFNSKKDSIHRYFVVFTKKAGDTVSFKDNYIYVPKNFKLLGLRFYIPHDAKESATALDRTRPGRLHHMFTLLAENRIFPMTVHTNGSEYFMTVGQFKKKYSNPVEAKIGMVKDWGLSVTDAYELVDGLVPDIVKSGMFKFGVLGESVLPLVDEAPKTDEFGNQVFYGIPYQQVDSVSNIYTGDPTARGLAVSPLNDVNTVTPETRKAIQLAAELARRGQKDIFDTQAINVLARYIDPNSKVLSYLPDFLKTLDNLGRILFMVFWESKKFQDMYGKDDLPELIELLKNVFKNLGDLILFLKKKFPDISINTSKETALTL